MNLDGKKALKSKPKIYIADAAIRNAVLMLDNVLMDPEDYGVIPIPTKVPVMKIPAHAFLYLLGHAEKTGYLSLSRANPTSPGIKGKFNSLNHTLPFG